MLEIDDTLVNHDSDKIVEKVGFKTISLPPIETINISFSVMLS